MKNTITVSIPFSFKGENYAPSIKIDLDEFVKTQKTFDSIVNLVARQNNIDPYSYEYEVLESSPLFFSEAGGVASQFLNDGQFDLNGFSQYVQQSRLEQLLQSIAQKHLGVEDLQSDIKLKQALQEAYNAGLKQKD